MLDSCARTDAIGQHFACPIRAADGTLRVVSLVPSETENVATLTSVSLLVGRTEFCVEPAEAVRQIPTIGGTKNAKVPEVIALRPDLVLANKEENTRHNVEALIAAGVPVFVSFPQRVREIPAHLRTLGWLLSAEADAERHATELETAIEEATQPRTARPRVFVPIWDDPLMSFNNDTYAGDLLALSGFENVCGERDRRYPLRADLDPTASANATERDRRYPRLSRDELVSRNPDLVLLPDEPWPYTDSDRVRFELVPNRTRVEQVDGKDLFWMGVRSADALRRLTERAAASSK